MTDQPEPAPSVAEAAEPVAGLPRLTDAMMRAACKAHFGTDNIDGIVVTVKERDWSFREAFKRMWSGARSALIPAPSVAEAAEPVAWRYRWKKGIGEWKGWMTAHPPTWKDFEIQPLFTHPAPSPVVPSGLEALVPDYDAGLLNDYGAGDVAWWQDYLRAEIGRANDHWREHHADAIAALIRAAPRPAPDNLRAAAAELVDRDLAYDGNKIIIECASHGEAIALVRKVRQALGGSPGTTRR